MHTTRGRELGRDVMHFATEASRVTPQVDDEGVRAIHERYLAFLKDKDQLTGEPETEPLRMNGWQY